jgi:alginate O-acetyltransferase complex protein AlgI
MLLATGLTYGVFKAVTFRPLSPGRAVAYALLWPGMDARPFEASRPPEGLGLMAWGMTKMALGATLLMLPRTGVLLLDAPRVLLGIGFLVHLGFLDALTGFWRLRGIPVGRLFENPAASRTLGEFWGRRWNLAFHVVARERVFRPVARRWGSGWGTLAAFLFSGVLHDLLLSLPAGGGYGLPTVYFLLQGVLVLVERTWSIRSRGWALLGLVLPIPLLFHRAFLEAIIRPLA